MIEKAAVMGFIIMAINQLRKVKLKHLISVSAHTERERTDSDDRTLTVTVCLTVASSTHGMRGGNRGREGAGK